MMIGVERSACSPSVWCGSSLRLPPFQSIRAAGRSLLSTIIIDPVAELANDEILTATDRRCRSPSHRCAGTPAPSRSRQSQG